MPDKVKNLDFDYDSWAELQLRNKERQSILLSKAEQLARLVPAGDCFENAIEIGCAEGIVINRICELLNIKKCYGIDISSTFLKTGSVRFPRIQFIKASGTKLSFKDKSIDLIILSDIIEHIEDLHEFMNEVKRVGKKILLKVPLDKYLWRKLISEPLGRSFIVGSGHPDGHLHEFSKDSCENLLKSLGFVILVSEVSYFEYLRDDIYINKNIILKVRWFLDIKMKQLFPSFAHKIFGGALLVYARL